MKVYTPCGKIARAEQHLAQVAPARSLRIGVLDNGKPNARLVMEHLGGRMADRLGAQVTLVTDKGVGRNAATACDPQILDRLSSEVDLVLVGSAD